MAQGEFPDNVEDLVQPLDYCAHVRSRPGMYLGGTDERALKKWLELLLEPTLKQAFEGYCDHVWLRFAADGFVELTDNGQGIPLREPWGIKRIEIRMTTIGTGAPYGGLFGFPTLMTVNALADICSIEVRCEGYLWQQDHRAGKPQAEVARVRALEANETNGTRVFLRPDFTIFESHPFVYETWVGRFRELACMFPRVTFSIRDDRTGQAADFHFPEGLSAYLSHFNRDRTAIHAPLLGSSQATITNQGGLTSTVSAGVAIQFNDTDETAIIGYLNTESLPSGLHMDIALETIRSVINNDWFPWTNLSLEHVKRGLTVVIHLIHQHPRFQGNLNHRLVNADACGVVAEALSAALTHRQNHKDEIEAKLRANGAPFTNKYKQT